MGRLCGQLTTPAEEKKLHRLSVGNTGFIEDVALLLGDVLLLQHLVGKMQIMWLRDLNVSLFMETHAHIIPHERQPLHGHGHAAENIDTRAHEDDLHVPLLDAGHRAEDSINMHGV